MNLKLTVVFYFIGDICETTSKVINHDVPTAKRGGGATLVTKIDPK